MHCRIHPPVLLITLPLLLSLCTPSGVAASDENIPTPQVLSQLEMRAQQASPRDRCFRYTELVHTMTEIAGRQMLQGDVDQAGQTLKKVEEYASIIREAIAKDTKHIKDAEQLMHQTTYRLGEYLHRAASEDRPTLEAALKQLNEVHEELLTQVFKN